MGSFQRPNNHSQMTGVSRKVRHLRHEEGSEKSVLAVLDFPEASTRLSSFSTINSGWRKQWYFFRLFHRAAGSVCRRHQKTTNIDDKEKLKLKLTPLKVWLVNASPGLINAKSQWAVEVTFWKGAGLGLAYQTLVARFQMFRSVLLWRTKWKFLQIKRKHLLDPNKNE